MLLQLYKECSKLTSLTGLSVIRQAELTYLKGISLGTEFKTRLQANAF